jgi:hypothetical protein
MQRLFVLREDRHLTALAGFLTQNWRAFAAEGRFLAVTVSLYKSKRSLAQNRRYFGVVLERIAAQGWVGGRQYGQLAWHEHFKRQFIGILELPGGATVGMSSADLNVEEFATFMQQVEAWAACELGVEFD